MTNHKLKLNINYKKILFSIYFVFSISLALFFSYQIFIKIFFNENFIETPDLTNFDYLEAFQILREYEISLEIVGENPSKFEKDRIYSQTPHPGTTIKKGRRIKIWVSTGKHSVILPDLIGMNFSTAESIINNLGLHTSSISYAHHSLGFNQVIATEPEVGTTVERNEGISFLVSLRETSRELFVPDIIGMMYDSALSQIQQRSLVIGNIEYIYDRNFSNNIVMDVEPRPGERVLPGQVINLILNNKQEVLGE